MDNSEKLLEAILTEQRDAREEMKTMHKLLSEVRYEVAGILPRVVRLEQDVSESKSDRKAIWNKLYEFGFQAAVVAYIVMQERPWSR
jgi:uncharacterized protein (UPF0335 family)